MLRERLVREEWTKPGLEMTSENATTANLDHHKYDIEWVYS